MQPNDSAFMLARCRKLALEAMLAAAVPPPPPPPPRACCVEDVDALPDDVAAAGLPPQLAAALARVCRALERGVIPVGLPTPCAPVAPGGRGARAGSHPITSWK